MPPLILNKYTEAADMNITNPFLPPPHTQFTYPTVCASPISIRNSIPLLSQTRYKLHW